MLTADSLGMDVLICLILTFHVYLVLISSALLGSMSSFGPAVRLDKFFRWSLAINRFLIQQRNLDSRE